MMDVECDQEEEDMEEIDEEEEMQEMMSPDLIPGLPAPPAFGNQNGERC